MKSRWNVDTLSALTGGILAIVMLAPIAFGQDLTEPVYRVAKETPATSASASTLVSETDPQAAQSADFFDLTRRENEHPLAPCKRMAEKAKAEIDKNINDYTCTFSKMERIDGKLTGVQHMHMQVMNDPFSIYLKFIKPKKGQECLYVDGANDNKLIALASGWRRNVGKLNLDPHGSMAMDGNRHPITKAGLRNLCEEIITISNNDMKYGECEVKNFPDVKMDGRPAVMIEAIHPVLRREFKFHIARVYIDREHRVPVRFEAYSWPEEAGGKPVLEELYVYTNLQFNTGCTASDFSTDNPEFFK